MSSNDLPAFPRESLAARIGHLGVRALTIHAPLDWRIRDLTGDDEVGYDAQIQVVIANRYKHLFHAQVKASTDNKLSTSGEFYSVRLEVKTLNYFRQHPTPLMLVFCGLPADQSPHESTVAFTWIHDEVLRRYGTDYSSDDPPDKEVTFRVPAKNVLTPATDISADLDAFTSRSHVLDSLLRQIEAVEGTSSGALGAIENLTSNVQKNGLFFLETISGHSERPWPEAEKGSVPDLLQRCDAAIDAGEIGQAEELLEELRGQAQDAVARAEYHFLTGRLHTWLGQHAEASRSFEEATRIRPDEGRFVAALYEAKFITDYDPENLQPVESLRASMPSMQHPRVIATKARILGALGKADEALAILKELKGDEAAIERVLIPYIREDWNSAIAVAEEVAATASKRVTRATLQILKCRSLFHKTVGNTVGSRMPPAGLPHTDISALQALWPELEKALDMCRSLRWPTNARHIVDVVAVVAGVLGRSRDVLPDVLEFASLRPAFSEGRDAAVALAVHADQPKQVLNLLSPWLSDPDRVHDAIVVMYGAGETLRVADVAEAQLLVANQDNRFHADCLLIGALCADSVARPAVRDRLLERLRSRADWRHHVTVFNYLRTKGDTKSAQDEALARLKEAHVASPHVAIIQDHLLPALPSSDAPLVLTIAERISERRRLLPHETEDVVRACITEEEYPKAHALLASARKQFGRVPRLLGLEVIVLEAEGRSQDALGILQELMSSGDAPRYSRAVLINIAIRNGFHDQAIRQFEVLLANSQDRSERFDCLRNLFALELAKGTDPERLSELTRRLGATADQNSETEEAAFLGMCVTLSTLDNSDVSADLKEEFDRRSPIFLNRFPESTLFSKFDIPDSGGAEALVAAVKKVVGLTAERERFLKKVENQLNRDEIAAPFCWRPRNLLSSVRNVPHLWEIAKRSKASAHAYHLSFAPGNKPYETKDLRQAVGVPLIDLTTLVVAADLQLFPLVFQLFESIAITKRTLIHIQAETSGFGLSTAALRAIRETVKERFARIQQPGIAEVLGSDGGLDEIKSLVRSGSFLQYSDDICARLWVHGDGDVGRGITTADVLATGEQMGWISSRDAAARYAQLARWNVRGLPIYFVHFLAAIPVDVGRARSVKEAIQIMLSAEDFATFANALWNFDKSYVDTVQHVGSVIARILVGSSEASEIVLAGLLSIWLDKVQFRTEPDFSREGHLATAVCVAAGKTGTHRQQIGKLWSAYIHTIERLYGNEMDEAKEAEARRVLGRKVASVAEHNADSGDLIYQALKFGLTDGTFDYDVFAKSYTEELERRTAQASKRH
jgi:tetratricopeptide (TPR) repeat protein